MTRILIVDEDTNVLRLLRIKLEAAGYEVVRARDGAEALAAVAEHHPDMVIMEPLMPDIQGRELVSQVRAAAKRTPLILVLSIQSDDEDVAAMLVAGASDYITKPFSPQVLLERIRVNLIRASMITEAGERS